MLLKDHISSLSRIYETFPMQDFLVVNGKMKYQKLPGTCSRLILIPNNAGFLEFQSSTLSIKRNESKIFKLEISRFYKPVAFHCLFVFNFRFFPLLSLWNYAAMTKAGAWLLKFVTNFSRKIVSRF